MDEDKSDDRTETSARYSVNAVTSAMSVFAAVVQQGSISLDQAAAVAEVSRSTAYRLVVTLTELGLVEKIPAGGYGPGPMAFQWAGKLLNQLDVRSIAHPSMRRLRDETGESVNLALLTTSELVYVDSLESPGLLRTVEEVGTVVPVHAAAIGKAVAAFLPPDQLGRLLPPEPYRKLGPKTIRTWPALTAQLEEVRSRGYALDVEEVAEGVVCVAAPILVGARAVGAMSLSGPRARLSDERLVNLGTQIMKAAEDVSLLLDHERGSAAT